MKVKAHSQSAGLGMEALQHLRAVRTGPALDQSAHLRFPNLRDVLLGFKYGMEVWNPDGRP